MVLRGGQGVNVSGTDIASKNGICLLGGEDMGWDGKFYGILKGSLCMQDVISISTFLCAFLFF